MNQPGFLRVTTLPGPPPVRHPLRLAEITRVMPVPQAAELRRDSRPTETITVSLGGRPTRAAHAAPFARSRGSLSPAPALAVVDEARPEDLEDLPTHQLALTRMVAESSDDLLAEPGGACASALGPALAIALGVLGGLAAGVLVVLGLATLSPREQVTPRAAIAWEAPDVEELRMRSEPEVVVPAPRSDSPRAAIVPQRWLDVRSEPPHAAVVLHGELIGYTPLTIMRDTLRPGQRLRLERPGFEVAEAEVPRGAWVRKRGRLEQRVFARLRQITVARDG